MLVRVGVFVGVRVTLGVGVMDGVRVAVGVRVTVGVTVNVNEGVIVGVSDGSGVFVGTVGRIRGSGVLIARDARNCSTIPSR